MKIALDVLQQKVVDLLTEKFNQAQAERVAEVLLWADKAGLTTQGVLKLMGTEPLQDVVPKGAIKIERESPASALIDAEANPAPLVLSIATDMAIGKAKAIGIATVGVHDLHSSTGAQGFYAQRIADAGLIGIVQSRASSSTAGFGSIDPLFGTNPIAFGFPTQGHPVIFDMSTSAMTWSGLVLAAAQGKEIPEGMAIDADGNPTLDPGDAMNGALRAFGSDHKGEGIAFAVEMLAGVLVGADYGQSEGEWGASVIVIDPETMIGREEFRRRSSDLIRKIAESRPAAGGEIRIPGMRSLSSIEEAERTNVVDVDEAVLRHLGFLDN